MSMDPLYRTVTEFPHKVKVIKNAWIELKDGARLAARIWLPEDAEERPAPAILEYLPYRKGDNTAARDSIHHAYFAGYGYAAVRVDMRGSGDSDGLLLDEYLPQEQLDALEVIEWLARQPWCSGAVGMMGISWGGFNSLQVAARQPAALKAIITVCSTDDRYTDDCHYMGGCVLGSDLLSWASVMLAYNALPPDPDVVGACWKEMWRERMENAPPFIEAWLSHQQRDDFWKQGSVIEDYSAIQCAVYAVGGWVDPYTNAVPRLLEGLSGPRKGLIGPWAHAYPHLGLPRPAIGFLQECLRWWDHWLKGMDSGIMDEPMLRVWMPESRPPQPLEEEWPGRWVAERGWPVERTVVETLYMKEGALTAAPGAEREERLDGIQSNGAGAGAWCPYGNAVGMPVEQRGDDCLSLSYTSAAQAEGVEILGFPEVTLKLSVDQPNALVAVRLCDVDPNGSSRLVSWALLNLTHRGGHANPAPLTPGEVYSVRVRLNAAAHHLKRGHRWRVAVSPTYWPHAWPSPAAARLTLHSGSGCQLRLPIRPPGDLDETLAPFARPEGAAPPEYEVVRAEGASRTLMIDQRRALTELNEFFDDGEIRFSDGLSYGGKVSNVYTIVDDEPASARVTCKREISVRRGQWDIRVETASTMTCDETDFYLTNQLAAYESQKPVYTREWTKKIRRELV